MLEWLGGEAIEMPRQFSSSRSRATWWSTARGLAPRATPTRASPPAPRSRGLPLDGREPFEAGGFPFHEFDRGGACVFAAVGVDERGADVLVPEELGDHVALLGVIGEVQEIEDVGLSRDRLNGLGIPAPEPIGKVRWIARSA